MTPTITAEDEDLEEVLPDHPTIGCKGCGRTLTPAGRVRPTLRNVVVPPHPAAIIPGVGSFCRNCRRRGGEIPPRATDFECTVGGGVRVVRKKDAQS